MEDLKIKINNNADEIVDLLGYLGVKALGFSGEKNYILVEMGVAFFVKLESNFLSSEAKETTLQELRDMVVLKRNDVGDATHVDQYGDKWICVSNVWYFYSGVGEWSGDCKNMMHRYYLKPIKEEVMKEFLNPEQNYSLVECRVGETPIPESWIEVPDGSNIYGKNKICGVTEFYRNDGKHDLLKIGKDGVWVRSKYHVGNIIDYWVREKESIIDKLVVDDLPELKHGIDATLAERQAQYGEFSDVAELTSDLMGDLLKDDMSFVQREALHMICSKLSRLRHGDVNKIDTWLDIAGYATLVVRDLEKRGK